MIKAPTQIAMEAKSSDQEEKLEILESMRDLWKRDNNIEQQRDIVMLISCAVPGSSQKNKKSVINSCYYCLQINTITR